MTRTGYFALALLYAPISALAGEVGASFPQLTNIEAPRAFAIEETGASAGQLKEQVLVEINGQTIDEYVSNATDELSLEMQKRILDNLHHVWTADAVVQL